MLMGMSHQSSEQPKLGRKPTMPSAVAKYVRRRRAWRWAALAAVASLLVLLSAADHRGWLLYQGGDLGRYDDRRFVVLRVLDGDTIDLAVADGEQRYSRVRLWGVDAPELGPDGQPSQPWAEEATAMTDRLVAGQAVVLDLEPHRLRDRFGRLLAYVKLSDGTVLNEQLLLSGLAEADDRWPHRAMEHYELLQDAARKRRVGLWKK